VRLGALVCLCSEARRAVASRSATSVASGGQSRVAGGVECESVCTVVNFFHSAAAQHLSVCPAFRFILAGRARKECLLPEKGHQRKRAPAIIATTPNVSDRAWRWPLVITDHRLLTSRDSTPRSCHGDSNFPTQPKRDAQQHRGCDSGRNQQPSPGRHSRARFTRIVIQRSVNEKATRMEALSSELL
jgi:hypothetical protein